MNFESCINLKPYSVKYFQRAEISYRLKINNVKHFLGRLSRFSPRAPIFLERSLDVPNGNRPTVTRVAQLN